MPRVFSRPKWTFDDDVLKFQCQLEFQYLRDLLIDRYFPITSKCMSISLVSSPKFGHLKWLALFFFFFFVGSHSCARSRSIFSKNLNGFFFSFSFHQTSIQQFVPQNEQLLHPKLVYLNCVSVSTNLPFQLAYNIHITIDNDIVCRLQTIKLWIFNFISSSFVGARSVIVTLFKWLHDFHFKWII